jgi:hypothetical protein
MIVDIRASLVSSRNPPADILGAQKFAVNHAAVAGAVASNQDCNRTARTNRVANRKNDRIDAAKTK